MPFSIERNDLASMDVDAIVVPANRHLKITGGAGGSVALAAGLEELQRACDEIGHCDTGCAVATPGFALRAQHIVHVVGPVWVDGKSGEFALLRRAYESALSCAASVGAQSVALPLVSAGTYGFPADASCMIALDVVRKFLQSSDMDVKLVLYDRRALVAGLSLYGEIAEYIDDHYVQSHALRPNLPRWDADARFDGDFGFAGYAGYADDDAQSVPLEEYFDARASAAPWDVTAAAAAARDAAAAPTASQWDAAAAPARPPDVEATPWDVTAAPAATPRDAAAAPAASPWDSATAPPASQWDAAAAPAAAPMAAPTNRRRGGLVSRIAGTLQEKRRRKERRESRDGAASEATARLSGPSGGAASETATRLSGPSGGAARESATHQNRRSDAIYETDAASHPPIDGSAGTILAPESDAGSTAEFEPIATAAPSLFGLAPAPSAAAPSTATPTPPAAAPSTATPAPPSAAPSTATPASSVASPSPSVPSASAGLDAWLDSIDAPFSTTLLALIDERGFTDAQVYKRANMSRQHFSKIRSDASYRPTKKTALALAVALELNLEETSDLLKRAGFALSNSSKADLIVEYHILNRNYDIFAINEALYAFDQPLL